MRSIAIILACTWAWASTAHAQVELKNDGFAAGGQVGFQSGFCNGEVAASRFVAPEDGRQLLKVRFLFGSTAETKQVSIVVWDDTAGTTMPGTQLFTGDYQVTGSANGIVESDLTSVNIVVPRQFRVGVQLKHMGLPSVARDADGTITADRNYVMSDSACDAGGPFTWYRSSMLGLMGDWVIRAEISASAQPPSDAGIDASTTPSGGPCAANPECPIGQYCDLGVMRCTYDCVTNSDCGDGTCNSLGQCIASNDGGGCGCRSNDASGSSAGFVLGLGILIVVRRRRR